MNKYDEKVLEIEEDAESIIELMRKKKMNALEKTIDFVFTNSLTVADGLSLKGAFYLVTKAGINKLVNISRDLQVEQFDVTNEVQNSPKSKMFEYEGNYYKTFRKVR